MKREEDEDALGIAEESKSLASLLQSREEDLQRAKEKSMVKVGSEHLLRACSVFINVSIAILIIGTSKVGADGRAPL